MNRGEFNLESIGITDKYNYLLSNIFLLLLQGILIKMKFNSFLEKNASKSVISKTDY